MPHELLINRIERGPPITVHLDNGRSVQFNALADLERFVREPPESAAETVLRQAMSLILEADPTLSFAGAIRDRLYQSGNPTWGTP